MNKSLKISRIQILPYASWNCFLFGFLGVLGSGNFIIRVLLKPSGFFEDADALEIFFKIVVTIFFPLFCALIGFIFGYISAIIVNLAMKYSGGLIVEYEDQ